MSSALMDYVIIAGTLLCLLFLLYLVVQSRKWTEPGRALRLEAVEDAIRALRGNFERFQRDTTANMRETQDCLHNILTEVQVIRESGSPAHPLVEKVEQMAERVEDLEQAVHSLPCGQHAIEACPAKET